MIGVLQLQQAADTACWKSYFVFSVPLSKIPSSVAAEVPVNLAPVEVPSIVTLANEVLAASTVSEVLSPLIE